MYFNAFKVKVIEGGGFESGDPRPVIALRSNGDTPSMPDVLVANDEGGLVWVGWKKVHVVRVEGGNAELWSPKKLESVGK